MSTPQYDPADLPNRIAGWFFVIVGLVLLALGAALLTSSVVAGWWIGGAGVLVAAFGVVAPRTMGVSVLYFLLVAAP